MNIIISNSEKTPIYEQIKKQIKMMILDGTLKEGDMLPSMRYLAKELRISMITTKRAYEELEREGYIESFVGRGSFIKDVNHDFIKEQLKLDMEAALKTAVHKAKMGDVSADELAELVRIMYEE